MSTSDHSAPTSGNADDPGDPAALGRPTRRAGAFDIRTIIGGLIGFYGIVLLVMGIFFADPEELARADGENLNLWTGAGLLVSGLLFLLWVKLRPLEVPVDAPAEPQDGSSDRH